MKRLIFVTILILADALVGYGSEVAPPDSHRVKPGETLADIAADYYGDRCFDGVIARYNDIPNQNRIAAGRELFVPTVDSILAREGLTSHYPYFADALVRVWQTHHRMASELSGAAYERRWVEPEDAQYLPFPDSLKPIFRDKQNSWVTQQTV